MDDLATMYILKCHTDLNKPMEDLRLTKCRALLLLPLDVICQIAHFTILHHNYQRVVS